MTKRRNHRQGTSVKTSSNLQARSLLCAAAGVLTILIVAAGAKPAAAQASDAADRCTPDVMRLCNEFVPDVEKITACMSKKRSQLSPECAAVFKPKRRRRPH